MKFKINNKHWAIKELYRKSIRNGTIRRIDKPIIIIQQIIKKIL